MTPERAIAWLIACILIFGYIVYLSNKKPKGWTQPKIKDRVPTKWGWVVRHPKNLSLRENTDIGYGTYIQAKNKIIIEKNVMIGANCSIYTENTIDGTSCSILIRENSKIGANTVILPKTNSKLLIIGENATIGACSLVKDSIPDNSIAFGTPAKVWKIKEKYTGDIYGY